MFWIKPVFNKANYIRKDGTAKVHIRWTHQRKQDYFDTDIYILPNQWKDDHVINHPEEHDLNDEIDDIVTRSKKFWRQCKRDRSNFSLRLLREHMENAYIQDSGNLIDYITLNIERSKNSESTMKKHKDLKNRLAKYRGEQITFSDINPKFINNFKHWLYQQDSRRGGKIGTNYVSSLLALLRSYCKSAIADQLLTSNPFAGIRLDKEASIIVVNTEAELDLLFKLDLSKSSKIWTKDEKYHPSMSRVRYRYLFLAYTGMRFGDHTKVGRENIEGLLLKYIAVKTRKSKGKTARVPLDLFEGRALKIFEMNNYNWRSYDNYQFNIMIRRLMKLAGIKKYIKVHTARHSFKSIMLEKGYSLSIIAEMMGHSSTQTTERYGKISDSAVLKKP